MKIRTIIADDEALAREGLKAFLAEEPDVEVVEECPDGASTVRAVERRQPDLLFLDVQMPEFSGFDVLEAIDPASMPLVVFTTAHDEHAIRAFEVNALDYLLKPFTSVRFKKAVQRVREQIAARSAAGVDSRLVALLASLGPPGGGGRRVLVKSADHISFVKAEEIDHVDAAGNYVILHAGNDRHIVRETMSSMETRLGPAGFMRISRSAIVNLSRIARLEPLVAPGEFCLVLKSGARLDMTCTLSELQQRMGAA